MLDRDAFNAWKKESGKAVTEKILLEEIASGKLPLHKNVQQGYTNFIMSFYTGLVNRIAVDKGHDAIMTERQSFGYASPSIAETIGSFRINLGLMPPEYAKIHVLALQKLDTVIEAFSNSPMERKPDEHAGFNKSEAKDWRKLALEFVEKGQPLGHIALYTATRSQAGKGYVNATAFNAAKPGQELNAFQKAFAGSLGGLKDKGDDRTTWDGESESYSIDAGGLPGSQAKYDETYHNELIKPYTENLTVFLKGERASPSPVLSKEAFEELNQNFEEAIDSLNDPANLVDKFDIINDYLAMYALLHETAKESPGDFSYGSESEADDVPEERPRKARKEARDSRIGQKLPIKIKKIITHNGMRALLAPLEAEVARRGTPKLPVGIDYANTYYELVTLLDETTALRLKTSNKTYKKSSTEQAGILVRDANAAAVDGQATVNVLDELRASTNPVWLIDTTSSTQEQMRHIVDAFRGNDLGETLYLVSSGFKNEQGGADKNTYGTIRVVARGGELVDASLTAIRAIDQPLADISHEYRRILKNIGFVPRDEEIIKSPKTVAA